MKRRAIAICLSLILTVTGIVAALPVMVNFASAADPVTGYFDDLMEQARNYCPAASLTQFDNVVQQIHDNFNSWLVVIIYRPNDQSWYVASYQYEANRNFQYWYYTSGWTYFRPWYNPNPSGDNNFQSRYGFKIYNSSISFETYGTGLGNTRFNVDPFSTSGWLWYVPDSSDLNESSRSCYSNMDLYHEESYGIHNLYMSANLVNGSYAPPIIDFHWFKFQLGQRWYITTYDQSLVNMMVVEEDSFWALWLDVRDNLDILTDYFVVWPDMMQRLPGAENFISQNLTNLSPSGVFAYDITDLVLNASDLNDHLANANFYSYSGTENDWLTNLVAQSSDVVDLNLTPEEENKSQNNAWENISDYMENYPSVTISPQALAEQVLGTRAYTGSMGVIQMPESVYNWCHSNYPDQVSNLDYGNHAIDGYWHFRLDGSGIDSVSYSMINWSICNACIIPAPEDTWLNNTLGIDSYAFPVYWWNPSDQLISDASFLGTFPVDYIFQMFDIVIFAPSEAVYLSDFGSNMHYPGTIGFCNLNYDTTIGPANGSAKQTVFICSTDKVLFKSQLFTFCDSQSKLYDLLSEYIQKRDLWDESFLKWSLSVFWELETINGHLNNIETILGNWTFSEWFQDLSDKLSLIADNTSETQEPMWYESLWNWVRKFTPSDNAFTNGLNAIETGLDNIPDIALPTHYPDYPLLPTFTPTPVPIEGS